MAKRKTFEHGEAVEVKRDPGYGQTWEPATYIKAYADWRGHHQVRLMTEMSRHDGSHLAYVTLTMSVPSVRIRSARKK